MLPSSISSLLVCCHPPHLSLHQARNTEELDGVLKALNGDYILPEAGGDLLRDGAGVLPTGGSGIVRHWGAEGGVGGHAVCVWGS